MFDIVTIGSALLDIYVYGKKLKTMDTSGGLMIGSVLDNKTEVDNIVICSGGGASNNAVSFARKGLRVGLIAELGTDLAAATVKEELRREKVELSLLVEEHNETTGTSVILVDQSGRRAVNVYRGASGMLSEDDIPFHLLDTNWLYISSVGGNLKLIKELLGFCKSNHIKVAFNPGTKELLEMSLIKYQDLLEMVDILILNREEAKILTKKPFDNSVYFKNPEAKIVGPPIVVITDGRRGGKIIDHENVKFYSVDPVRAIEETGAGDAFGSGVVAGLIMGKSLDQSIAWGKRQSAAVVSYIGAKKGLLTLKEIDK